MYVDYKRESNRLGEEMKHPMPYLVDKVRQEYADNKPISEILEMICREVDSTSAILCVLYIRNAFGISLGHASWVGSSEVLREGGLTSEQLQEKMVPFIEEKKRELDE